MEVIKFVSHTGTHDNLKRLVGKINNSTLSDLLEVTPYHLAGRDGWEWTGCLESLKEQRPLLAEVGSTRVAAWAKEGLLVDLTDFATDLSIRTKFPHRAIASCYWDNKCWAIPFLLDVRLLFVNLKLLEENNVDLDKFKTALQHADAFETFCCEEIAPRLKVPIIAFAAEDSMHDVLPWIWSSGGEIIGEHKTIHLHAEETYQGLKRAVRCAFFRHGKRWRSINDIRTAFHEEKVLMVSGNFWMIESSTPHHNIEVALPPPGLEAATFFGGTHLAIVRQPGEEDDSDVYDLPKKCLKKLVDPFNNERFAFEVKHLPAHIGAWRQFLDAGENMSELLGLPRERLLSILRTFDFAISAAKQRVLPSIPEVAPMEEILRQGFQTIWDGIVQCKDVDACDEVVKSKLKEIEDDVEGLIGSPVKTIRLHRATDTFDDKPDDYDLFVNEVHSEIYVNGHLLPDVNMNHKRFKVLSALLRAKGCRLNWEEIYSRVWSRTTLDARTLSKMDELMDEILLLLEPDEVLLKEMRLADDDASEELATRFVERMKRPLPKTVDENFQRTKPEIAADYQKELKSLAQGGVGTGYV